MKIQSKEGWGQGGSVWGGASLLFRDFLYFYFDIWAFVYITKLYLPVVVKTSDLHGL